MQFDVVMYLIWFCKLNKNEHIHLDLQLLKYCFSMLVVISGMTLLSWDLLYICIFAYSHAHST